MANIIRGKNQSPSTDAQAADLNVNTGSKAAILALKSTGTSTTTPEAKTAAKADKASRKQQNKEKAHAHEKSAVEQREEQSLKLKAAGTITGAAARSNKQLTGNAKSAVTGEVEDAWDDSTTVNPGDDLDTALEKVLMRAEAEAQIESQIDAPDVIIDLNEVEGLNSASQPIRDHGNFAALNNSPELLIMMGGLSETFDNLLQQNGIEMQNPAEMTDQQLQEIFALLNTKKKKVLSEDEEEAELILSGAVGILAIPKILEKLEELGLNPDEAKSFHGALKTLLDKVQQDDSPYNYLYKMIKEEAELSIIPEETETVA